MLHPWMDRIRDTIAELLDSDDGVFMQAVDRWRAIERGIHEMPADEPGFMTTQVSFLLIAILAYARLQLASDIDDDSFTELGSIAVTLCDALEGDDPRFQPYIKVVRFASARQSCSDRPGFSTIFKAIHDEHDAILDQLVKNEPGIDALSVLYQDLFSNPAKHASGEHYTPVSLCELMLDHLPITMDSDILDPTCGAGAFLVSTIHRVRSQFDPEGTAWLKHYHGEDLNPVAIIAARVNAWMQVRDLGVPITFFFDTIRISDILDDAQGKHDFIIGNPPWITLKDFTTTTRQKSTLALAKELQIAPDAHGVPQLELATIVFAKCLRDRLAPGGQIFLIMTSSFIDGKHCSKFRSLSGIDDAKIWFFEGEPVFPRKYACLLATKGPTATSYFKRHSSIDVITWQVTRAVDARGRAFIFSERARNAYCPANHAKLFKGGPGDQALDVEKFIPVVDASSLLPTDAASSYYKASCYNGATIFPQSLLFVDMIDDHQTVDDPVVIMRPAYGLHMKKPWNARVYETARVERRYIFDLVKGSELYPFGTQAPCQVFLPLKMTVDSFAFDGDGMEPGSHLALNQPTLASSHYARINKFYKATCKKAGRIADLWARVNFDNELTNPGMCKPFKVIFPDCGSTMAAAIVKGQCIVEHALHYIGLDDEDEAYYLLGVLNAPCVEKDVLIRKAERHIGQLLLDYGIPRFDAANQDHQDIVKLAKQLEAIARGVVAAAEIKTRALNAGKYQCKACMAFVKGAAREAHAGSCKKMQAFSSDIASPVDEDWFILVDEHSDGNVRVKFTRDAIKKRLLADSRVQQLLIELDVISRRLLERGMMDDG